MVIGVALVFGLFVNVRAHAQPGAASGAAQEPVLTLQPHRAAAPTSCPAVGTPRRWSAQPESPTVPSVVVQVIIQNAFGQIFSDPVVLSSSMPESLYSVIGGPYPAGDLLIAGKIIGQDRDHACAWLRQADVESDSDLSATRTAPPTATAGRTATDSPTGTPTTTPTHTFMPTHTAAPTGTPTPSRATSTHTATPDPSPTPTQSPTEVTVATLTPSPRPACRW